MLIPRRSLAKPAVIRNIEKRLRAIRRELPDVIRKHRFIANKRADLMRIQAGDNHLLPSRKITGLSRNLLRHQAERPGHKLTERHQIDLVIASHTIAVRIHQQRRVQWFS